MADRRNANHVLKIDGVLSTQPELGPQIPDGGYGWIILAATMFFQVLIPSMVAAYGVFMVFIRLENSAPQYPSLWDNAVIYTPLFFIASWTIVDPWSRRLISTSVWPRLVMTSGTCLTCAGILFIWFAISNATRTAPWFVTSGIFSGIGASLITAQCEVILAQYFKLKLKHANMFVQVAVAVGFVLTPVFLGKYIMKDGLPTVVIWYHIVILQGMAVALLIKKPPYLKGAGRNYKLVQGAVDDEIDIFAKNSTELQNARHSRTPSTNTDATAETNSTPSTSAPNEETNPDAPPKSNEVNLIDIEIHSSENGRPDWVSFEEHEENRSTKIDAKNNLHKSFAAEFNKDLDRIERFEDNFVHVPKPLFTETHVNNNNTYSFDDGATTSMDEPVVFVPANGAKNGVFHRELNFMKQPTFYKSLLQIITAKFSLFTFYALFPSYLYTRAENLNIHQATNLVGHINLAGLLFLVLFVFVRADTQRKAFFLWVFSWIGAFGYIILSDVRSETWLVIGAIQILVSIQSLQYFGGPLLKLSLRGETTTAHCILSSLSGSAFSIFFGIDFSYVNCFRMMALIQFVMGGVWFSNFLFKKIKPVFLVRTGE